MNARVALTAFFIAAGTTPALYAKASDGAATTAAADAFDAASAAFAKKHYERAADLYARADELAPNETALREALRAATLADNAALGLDLADRAVARRGSRALKARADEARRKFAAKPVDVPHACPPGAACEGKADSEPTKGVGAGAVAATQARASHAAGEPAAKAKVAEKPHPRAGVAEPTGAAAVPTPDASGTHAADGAVADAEAETAAPPPENHDPAAATSHPSTNHAPTTSGLGRGWFWVGAAATAVLGGVAVGYAYDAAQKHDAYVAGDGDRNLAQAGFRSQITSHILFGAAAAVGATTSALGLFYVDWSPHSATTTGRIGSPLIPTTIGLRGAF